MIEKNTKRQSGDIRCVAFFAVGLLLLVSGCSSLEKSVTLGVGTGLAVGASTSLIAGGQTETTLIAAGVGALVGGIASYAIHGDLEKRDEDVRRNTLFNLDNRGIKRLNSGRVDLSNVNGLMSMPDVEENWIETYTDGPKLIEGHREWTLLGSSQWDLSRKLPKKKRK